MGYGIMRLPEGDWRSGVIGDVFEWVNEAPQLDQVIVTFYC